MRCPICFKSVPDRYAPNWPFCSPRCQLVDLGRWTTEDYYIPGRVSGFSEDIEFEYDSVNPHQSEFHLSSERKPSI